MRVQFRQKGKGYREIFDFNLYHPPTSSIQLKCEAEKWMIINKDDVYCTPVYKEDHNGGKFEWEIKSRGLFKEFSF
jgi:hypothetical protein